MHVYHTTSMCLPQYVSSMPRKAGDQVVVISCPDDESACKPALVADIPIVNAEFILTGILRQTVDIESYPLQKSWWGHFVLKNSHFSYDTHFLTHAVSVYGMFIQSFPLQCIIQYRKAFFTVLELMFLYDMVIFFKIFTIDTQSSPVSSGLRCLRWVSNGGEGFKNTYELVNLDAHKFSPIS